MIKKTKLNAPLLYSTDIGASKKIDTISNGVDAKELTLNIAVNLGRIGRWAYEGRINRINQFLAETESYIRQLEQAKMTARFSRTFEAFRKSFYELKRATHFDLIWAEMMFTWANILTHRASLAG